MKYSFIEARKKSIFGLGFKIWIVFIITVEIILIIANIVISTQVQTYSDRKDDYISKIEELDENMKKLFNRQRTINKEAKIAERMRDSNTKLRAKIKRIFSLTPKDVIFHKVTWNKDALTLEGYTPTKDAFNFVLQTELESIYGSTKTVFFPRKTGGFNFSSKNISKDRTIKSATE